MAGNRFDFFKKKTFKSFPKGNDLTSYFTLSLLWHVSVLSFKYMQLPLLSHHNLHGSRVLQGNGHLLQSLEIFILHLISYKRQSNLDKNMVYNINLWIIIYCLFTKITHEFSYMKPESRFHLSDLKSETQIKMSQKYYSQLWIIEFIFWSCSFWSVQTDKVER